MPPTPSATPARTRPDIVYRVSWIDIAVKDPSPLIACVHELLHVEHAITRSLRIADSILDHLDTRQVPDTAAESLQTPRVSRVRCYRRSAQPNEEDFTDWKIPSASSIPAMRVEGTPPLSELSSRLVAVYAEIAELCEAAAEYGDYIDAMVRVAGHIPGHIDEYRAQSTSGSSGWKFESQPSRTIDVRYRELAL